MVNIEREISHTLVAENLVEKIKDLDKVIERCWKKINQIRSAYDGLVYPAKQKVTNYNNKIGVDKGLVKKLGSVSLLRDNYNKKQPYLSNFNF